MRDLNYWKCRVLVASSRISKPHGLFPERGTLGNGEGSGFMRSPGEIAYWIVFYRV